MTSGKSPLQSPLNCDGAEHGVAASNPYNNQPGLDRSSSTRSTDTSTATRTSVAGPNGYFVPHYPQPQQQFPAEPGDRDDLTILNTRANAQSLSPGAASAAAPAGAGMDATSVVAPAATHLRPAKFTEEWDANQRGSSIIDGVTMQRSNSYAGSTAAEAQQQLSRGNTLKKKASLRRAGSLKRSGSRRSMKAGSVRSLALQSSNDGDEIHSAFFCPVPTTGNPTETLANRFQAWRKVLKDLITYFREIQNHYEQRAKALLKLSNVLNNTSMPPGFATSGGLEDALQILRNHNKQAVAEANKAREIEEDVILAITGLRSDLHQKIKEIKNLSGDFKNSVDKEMDATRRTVKILGEALGQSEMDSATTTGKQDPYLLRLAVDRQLERQIEEENYLHRAYLNLENSGRELESIVVGEVQKAYNAYAGILKREGDAAFSTVDELRSGPIAMPKDHEWDQFVKRDDKFINPDVAVRSTQFVYYPGRDHYACQEIREGLLERKSKYLRSYTAGWYVLSPTHLHEFRSADKAQAPVMSLYLPEQKLGSHSVDGASSNKFILKGRQTGSMHRGHTWVFRAESYDTMMAWYEDIKALSEKSPEERSDFVRGHSRSLSRNSQRSASSDGAVDEDDAADAQPFAPDSAAISSRQSLHHDAAQRRPSPGGRFPSDLTVNAERGMQVPPISPASVHSAFLQQPYSQPLSRQPSQHSQRSQQVDPDAAAIAAASGLPGGDFGQHDPRLGYGATARTPLDEAPSHAAVVSQDAYQDGVNPFTSERLSTADKRLSLGSNGGAQSVGTGAGVSRGLGHRSIGHTSQQLQVAPGSEGLTSGYEPDGVRGTASVPAAAPTVSSGASSNLESDSYVSGGRNPGAGIGPAGGAATGEYLGAGFPPPGYQQPRTVVGVPPGPNANGSLGAAGGGRPISGTMRTDSGAQTISNLHIPGGYPKTTPTQQ